jgi:7,8-dihydropterin-6-yl-methyl-4-(beta-D-ribofuranosyl)aminobenzene 5'-phosphate synthase
MQVTAVIENSPAEARDDLKAEHGLSLHVQCQERQVLFDTGASSSFTDNATALAIDLGAVDLAVLSHHHYDHGGGLERFLSTNQKARVYLRKVEPADRYFRAFKLLKRSIGIDYSLCERFPQRFEALSTDAEVAPGIHLLTDIVTTYPLPRGNRHLFVEREGSLELDSFDHELVMVIVEDDGMVVFSGCSHNGILNMIETAVSRFPGLTLKAVFGGFHLIGLPFFNTMAASQREVEELGRRIVELSPGKVYTGHCTGMKAFHVLKRVMGDTLEAFPTGATITV